jgi:hypothetical protein
MVLDSLTADYVDTLCQQSAEATAGKGELSSNVDDSAEDLAGQLSQRLSSLAEQQRSAEGPEDKAPSRCAGPPLATQPAVSDPPCSTVPSKTRENEARVYASLPMPGPSSLGWDEGAGVKGPSTPPRKYGGVTPPHDAVRMGIRALADIEAAMSDEDVAELRKKIRAQKETMDAFTEVRACSCGSVSFSALCACQLQERTA